MAKEDTRCGECKRPLDDSENSGLAGYVLGVQMGNEEAQELVIASERLLEVLHTSSVEDPAVQGAMARLEEWFEAGE